MQDGKPHLKKLACVQKTEKRDEDTAGTNRVTACLIYARWQHPLACMQETERGDDDILGVDMGMASQISEHNSKTHLQYCMRAGDRQGGC